MFKSKIKIYARKNKSSWRSPSKYRPEFWILKSNKLIVYLEVNQIKIIYK